MQHLKTLMQLADKASSVIELARATRIHRFNVPPASTIYIDIGNADLFVARAVEPVVEITAKLQAPFAWRTAADQDDAGVYFVARRRPVVGMVAGAVILLTAPQDAHLFLKLTHCVLRLEDVSGDYHLAPSERGKPLRLNAVNPTGK